MMRAAPGLNLARVAGVDEAGRGPLAGPVVAAAVILDPRRRIRGLADSKVLSPAERARLAPIIRSPEFGHSRAEVVGRLDRLSAELGLDRERARGWAIAQTMAWSFDSAFADPRHETARWLLDAA